MKDQESNTIGEQFVCRLRLINVNPGVAFVTERDPESGESKTRKRPSASITMTGIKDPIFGPASPMFTVTGNIVNPLVVDTLLRAFREHYMREGPEGFAESTGVEMRATFEIVGPAPADTYP